MPALCTLVCNACLHILWPINQVCVILLLLAHCTCELIVRILVRLAAVAVLCSFIVQLVHDDEWRPAAALAPSASLFSVHGFLCRRSSASHGDGCCGRAAPAGRLLLGRSQTDRQSGRARREGGVVPGRAGGLGITGEWRWRWPAIDFQLWVIQQSVSRSPARPPAWISCSPQNRLLLDVNLYWCQSDGPTGRIESCLCPATGQPRTARRGVLAQPGLKGVRSVW